MKLISTIQEIRDQVPVSMTENIDTLKPFLSSAESQFVKFMIGKEQFGVLVTAYTDAGKDLSAITDNIVREAVELCQRVTSNLAYLMGLPVLNVSIGSSGVQIFSNQDTKSAFQWQVEDLKKSLQEIGYNAIEDLLDHLADNPDVFPQYIDSDEFIKSESFLIRNAKEFDEFFKIRQSRYTFQMMLYIMGRIEKQSVIPLFGNDFFKTLLENDLEGKTLELVEGYLKPGIALLVVAKAVIERIITIENGMAIVNIGANYESIKDNSAKNRESIKDASEQLTEDGNRFLQDGLTFLMNNLSDIPDFVPQEVKRGRFKYKNNPEKGVFAP